MAKKSFSKKPKAETRTADAIFDRFDQNAFDQKQRIKQGLEIHDELKPYIPPLKPEEFATLEDNILSEGRVRENLLVWKNPEGKYYLLDGHHRYQVITKHAVRDLTWDIEVKEDLQDIEEAKRFMRQLQLGRRNLTTHQMAYLRGRTYLDMKKNVGRSEDGQGRTRDLLAEEFKVGTKTIQRDAVFAAGVDRFLDATLPENLQEERDRILLHESVFLKGDVELLGRNPELPLLLSYEFRALNGSLKDVMIAPQEEWAALMKAFINSEGTPPVEIKIKPEVPSSPAPTPTDRFVKWWQQEQKQVVKIVKKGDVQAIDQKRQEITERIEKLQSLLSELQA